MGGLKCKTLARPAGKGILVLLSILLMAAVLARLQSLRKALVSIKGLVTGCMFRLGEEFLTNDLIMRITKGVQFLTMMGHLLKLSFALTFSLVRLIGWAMVGASLAA